MWMNEVVASSIYSISKNKFFESKENNNLNKGCSNWRHIWYLKNIGNNNVNKRSSSWQYIWYLKRSFLEEVTERKMFIREIVAGKIFDI